MMPRWSRGRLSGTAALWRPSVRTTVRLDDRGDVTTRGPSMPPRSRVTRRTSTACWGKTLGAPGPAAIIGSCVWRLAITSQVLDVAFDAPGSRGATVSSPHTVAPRSLCAVLRLAQGRGHKGSGREGRGHGGPARYGGGRKGRPPPHGLKRSPQQDDAAAVRRASYGSADCASAGDSI